MVASVRESGDFLTLKNTFEVSQAIVDIIYEALTLKVMKLVLLHKRVMMTKLGASSILLRHSMHTCTRRTRQHLRKFGERHLLRHPSYHRHWQNLQHHASYKYTESRSLDKSTDSPQTCQCLLQKARLHRTRARHPETSGLRCEQGSWT